MKELFLICPFSNAEMYIREMVNPNAYFLTAPGSVFRYQDMEYVESVVNFIQRKQIDKVYFVGHLQCRFLNQVIENKNATDFYAEEHFQQLIQDHQNDLGDTDFRREYRRKIMHIHLKNEREKLTKWLESYNIEVDKRILVVDNELVINHVKRRKKVSNEY